MGLNRRRRGLRFFFDCSPLLNENVACPPPAILIGSQTLKNNRFVVALELHTSDYHTYIPYVGTYRKVWTKNKAKRENGREKREEEAPG